MNISGNLRSYIKIYQIYLLEKKKKRGGKHCVNQQSDSLVKIYQLFISGNDEGPSMQLLNMSRKSSEISVKSQPSTVLDDWKMFLKYNLMEMWTNFDLTSGQNWTECFVVFIPTINAFTSSCRCQFFIPSSNLMVDWKCITPDATWYCTWLFMIWVQVLPWLT